jgi:hypothetical protein
MMEDHGDFNAREEPNGNKCSGSNGAATVRAKTEKFHLGNLYNILVCYMCIMHALVGALTLYYQHKNVGVRALIVLHHQEISKIIIIFF